MTQQAITPTVSQETKPKYTQQVNLIIKDRNQEINTYSLEDLTKIFLSPTEISKCYKDRTTIYLFSHYKFTFSATTAERWKKAIGRNNPNITYQNVKCFQWSDARQKIMRKYSFIEVNYIGSKNKAHGLTVKSIVPSPENPENHVQHVGEFRKAFKDGTMNHCYLAVEGCIAQKECDTYWMQKLMEYSK